MGLLDDAIREHLELKRRRGADPDEVARQENEALGETRRAEFARPNGDEAAETEAPATAEAAPAAESPGAEPVAAPPDFAAPEPSAEPISSPDETPPDHAEERVAPDLAPPDFVAPEPEAEPLSPPPETDVAPEDEPVSESASPVEAGDEGEPFDIEAEEGTRERSWIDDEPDEVPADEALDHPRTEEGEDVLEETPDFLQETPEHDRLWFEQRPPRDFDWDK